MEAKKKKRQIWRKGCLVECELQENRTYGAKKQGYFYTIRHQESRCVLFFNCTVPSKPFGSDMPHVSTAHTVLTFCSHSLPDFKDLLMNLFSSQSHWCPHYTNRCQEYQTCWENKIATCSTESLHQWTTRATWAVPMRAGLGDCKIKAKLVFCAQSLRFSDTWA